MEYLIRSFSIYNQICVFFLLNCTFSHLFFLFLFLGRFNLLQKENLIKTGRNVSFCNTFTLLVVIWCWSIRRKTSRRLMEVTAERDSFYQLILTLFNSSFSVLMDWISVGLLISSSLGLLSSSLSTYCWVWTCGRPVQPRADQSVHTGQSGGDEI